MKAILYCLLFSGLVALSAAASEESVSSPTTAADTVSLAAQQLEPIIEGVDSPFYVFHYARLSDDPLRKLNREDVDVKTHFEKWVAYYWDRSQDDLIKGYVHGMYAATDPVKTRSYAHDGEAFFMNRIEVTPGLRILNLAHAPMMSQQVANYLRSVGCSESQYAGLFQSGRGKGCRDFQLALLANLKVDAFEYNYSMDPIPDCQQIPLQEQVALVILRADHFAAKSIRTFVGETGSNDDAEEREILRDIAKKSADPKVRQYKAAHLLSCRNLRD